MGEPEKGPTGKRRGRGARERILAAAGQLFREQGINRTGMAEVSTLAQVSNRTAYQHFGSKDGLVAEYLRRVDLDTMATVFERPDLSPRERLLAVFQPPSARAHEGTTRTDDSCPFIGAAVEIADPEHPGRVLAREHKESVAVRLTEAAREAGAADPELLGEQLALLIDGASARTRTIGSDKMPTAIGIATMLIEQAIPEPTPARSRPPGERDPRPRGARPEAVAAR
jgi:AcrR family transcriptional regulator